MPFWKPEPPDPELEAARREAEEALPPGWEIHNSDREQFAVPGGFVVTFAICASGPEGQNALVIAVGEANAFRQFARHINGEIEAAEGWAVPVPVLQPEPPDGDGTEVRNPDLPEVREAKAELDAALPPGWMLYDVDRERYRFPTGQLETWGMTASGPSGEAVLAMGIGEAGSLRQLARALTGELQVADAWAPPMHYVTQD